MNSLVEQAEQSQLSPEEIRQLDEMMRSQVNDMLEDILKDRRKTCGMWEEEEEEVLKEGESDDSFDEKYLPRSSASLGSKEELSVEESPNENAEESPNENAEKAEKAEKETKKETKKEEEKRSPFMQLEKCDDAMMMELMGMDLPEEEEEIIADAIVNAMREKMEEKPEKDPKMEAELEPKKEAEQEPKKEAEKEPKKEAEQEPKKEAEQEPKKDAEEEEVLKEVDDGEEKKPKKSSGFWCRKWKDGLHVGKSTLLAAAVATVVVAKHFQK